MGYTRHHAIIVTTFDVDSIKQAHEKAVSIFGNTVSPVTPSHVNGHVSFLIAPDGSKEGWQESDTGDANRAKFKAWVKEQDFEDGSNRFDFIEVFYGDDEKEAGIVEHN